VQFHKTILFEHLKGYSHPKRKILSFTHPQIVANLYEFLSSAEHKGRYFEERLEPNSFIGIIGTSIVGKKKILWKSMVPKLQSFLCVQQERNSYRFATTLG